MHFAICKSVLFGSKARFQGKIFHKADQIESQTVKISFYLVFYSFVIQVFTGFIYRSFLLHF